MDGLEVIFVSQDVTQQQKNNKTHGNDKNGEELWVSLVFFLSWLQGGWILAPDVSISFASRNDFSLFMSNLELGLHKRSH